MTKYSFNRLTPESLEQMAQALLEPTFRASGGLIQFGPGKDGGREATWSQPPTHSNYVRPVNEVTDVPKEWIFQVKHHEESLRGWKVARESVCADLSSELEKVWNKHKLKCHAYILITNVPLTGVRHRGSRDRVSEIAKSWRDRIPQIEVWDANDLSRLLDNNSDVRQAYLDQLLPGDVLQALLLGVTKPSRRRTSAFRAYLQEVVDRERTARTEEAGGDTGLALSSVFVDLRLQHEPGSSLPAVLKEDAADVEGSPVSGPEVLGSEALLTGEDCAVLLLGEPGSGKSTLTQFSALFYATRLLTSDTRSLTRRLRVREPSSFPDLCRVRFPFRIELRKYAKWQTKTTSPTIARYIIEVMVNPAASASLTADSLFDFVSEGNSLIVFLDGLDEVPRQEVRSAILFQLDTFLRRVKAEGGSVDFVVSSRVRGYRGEFERYSPVTLRVLPLELDEFRDYCSAWISNRIPRLDREDAHSRVERGLRAPTVQRLAKNLLQATVMLTLVKRRVEIPHARKKLFDKYVEVIFDREKNKWPLVRDYEEALLLIHEKVAYELHQGEHTREGALSPSRFKEIVSDIMVESGHANANGRVFRRLISDVIEASTDRLCLLKGTGPQQRQVEFLLLSFQEYFAARFFRNHGEADPDLVFEALLQGGDYWANVLSFYIAFAALNQQMRWIHGLSDAARDLSDPGGFAFTAKAREMLIGSYHDLDIGRGSERRAAFSILAAPSLRWTLLSASESTLEVLASLLSDERTQEDVLPYVCGSPDEPAHDRECAAALVARLLSRSSGGDPLTKHPSVQECLQIASPTEKMWSGFLDKAEGLSAEQAHVVCEYPGLVEAEWANEAILNTEDEALLRVLLRSSLDADSIGRLTQSNLIKRLVSALSLQRVESAEFSNDAGRTESSSRVLGLIPQFWRPLKDSDVVGLIEELKSTGPGGRYLGTLLEALHSSGPFTHPHLTPELLQEIGWFQSYWKASTFLGPSYAGGDKARAELALLHQRDDWDKLLSDFVGNPAAFSARLLHPRYWRHLLDHGVVAEEDLEKLRASPLYRVLNCPGNGPLPVTVDLATHNTLPRGVTSTLDFFDLVGALSAAVRSGAPLPSIPWTVGRLAAGNIPPRQFQERMARFCDSSEDLIPDALHTLLSFSLGQRHFYFPALSLWKQLLELAQENDAPLSHLPVSPTPGVVRDLIEDGAQDSLTLLARAVSPLQLDTGDLEEFGEMVRLKWNSLPATERGLYSKWLAAGGPSDIDLAFLLSRADTAKPLLRGHVGRIRASLAPRAILPDLSGICLRVAESSQIFPRGLRMNAYGALIQIQSRLSTILTDSEWRRGPGKAVRSS